MYLLIQKYLSYTLKIAQLFANMYANISNYVFHSKQCLKFLAPNVYKVDIADKVLHESSPKHSFGARTNIEKPNNTPG